METHSGRNAAKPVSYRSPTTFGPDLPGRTPKAITQQTPSSSPGLSSQHSSSPVLSSQHSSLPVPFSPRSSLPKPSSPKCSHSCVPLSLVTWPLPAPRASRQVLPASSVPSLDLPLCRHSCSPAPSCSCPVRVRLCLEPARIQASIVNSCRLPYRRRPFHSRRLLTLLCSCHPASEHHACRRVVRDHRPLDHTQKSPQVVV